MFLSSLKKAKSLASEEITSFFVYTMSGSRAMANYAYSHLHSEKYGRAQFVGTNGALQVTIIGLGRIWKTNNDVTCA